MYDYDEYYFCQKHKIKLVINCSILLNFNYYDELTLVLHHYYLRVIFKFQALRQINTIFNILYLFISN